MYNSYYTFSSVCEGGHVGASRVGLPPHGHALWVLGPVSIGISDILNLTNKLEMSDKHAHNDRY